MTYVATKEQFENLPILDAVIFCPKCGLQHLDVGEWFERPHRTHLCDRTPHGPGTGCGVEFRVDQTQPTRGVPFKDYDAHAFYAKTWLKKITEAMLARNQEARTDDLFLIFAELADVPFDKAMEIVRRTIESNTQELKARIIGELTKPETLAEFAEHMKNATKT